MTGVKSPSGNPTYEELASAHAKLEAESGHQLIMQRDLIQARDQIDAELMRFKAIQSFIADALLVDNQSDFFALTLEALIEAFELEVALAIDLNKPTNTPQVYAAFGFEDSPSELTADLSSLSPDQSLILHPDHPIMRDNKHLNLQQAILCPIVNQDDQISAVILMGISRESSDYYDPITSEIESAFTVMVQQAGALLNNRQLNGEIILKNRKLEQEAGQLLIMQRDLVRAKDQVDDELGRFKSIQTYIGNALIAESSEDFFEVTLEAIVEAFEFEAALFVTLDEAGKNLTVVSSFGFDDPPLSLSYLSSWFDTTGAKIADPNDLILTAWSQLNLHQAILCPFVDKSDSFAGLIIAGITADSADYFDPIDETQSSAFTVMVQQAGALWLTRRLSDEIIQQNAKLVSLTDSYSRFVPFEFLDLLEKKSIEDIDAGANASIDMSVLFLDIRGFTALTEKLGPADTFTWLNSFLHEMEPIIADQKGFINQFQGDAIMALFPATADAALRCASHMISATRTFNTLQEAQGKMKIKFGLGINSGPVMLGAIGGANRLESNIVGDAANLAARTEGLTKIYGVDAIFTEFTQTRIQNPDGFSYRELDRVTVKGRKGAVTIFELLPEICDPEFDKRKSLTSFNDGLCRYRSGHFEGAQTAFKRALKQTPGDSAAILYENRCAQLIQTPPQDWDGISVIGEK